IPHPLIRSLCSSSCSRSLLLLLQTLHVLLEMDDESLVRYCEGFPLTLAADRIESGSIAAAAAAAAADSKRPWPGIAEKCVLEVQNLPFDAVEPLSGARLYRVDLREDVEDET
ncbi:hypothetical protein PRIPAC_93819, partial [Pristionchus pacificus]|uniref:Uncharacterized protein n=1 Tax=Pristionchus pacificus TaxID=54126 RepID=A0A2A6B9X7_PRIPA